MVTNHGDLESPEFVFESRLHSFILVILLLAVAGTTINGLQSEDQSTLPASAVLLIITIVFFLLKEKSTLQIDPGKNTIRLIKKRPWGEKTEEHPIEDIKGIAVYRKGGKSSQRSYYLAFKLESGEYWHIARRGSPKPLVKMGSPVAESLNLGEVEIEVSGLRDAFKMLKRILQSPPKPPEG